MENNNEEIQLKDEEKIYYNEEDILKTYFMIEISKNGEKKYEDLSESICNITFFRNTILLVLNISDSYRIKFENDKFVNSDETFNCKKDCKEIINDNNINLIFNTIDRQGNISESITYKNCKFEFQENMFDYDIDNVTKIANMLVTYENIEK